MPLEGKQSVKGRQFYLNLTYRCNNACLFCAAGSHKRKTFPRDIHLSEFSNILGRLKINNADTVIMNGGEPTILKSLPEMVTALGCVGARTILFTNGRKCCSLEFCEELLDTSKNIEIQIPIHGPNPQVHDSLTRRKGSFDQAVEGISNLLSLRKEGIALVLKTAMCKLNFMHLPQIAKLFAQRFPNADKIIFSSLIYDGNVLNEIDKNHFPIAEVGNPLGHAIQICKGAGIPVFLNKIPACVLDESDFLSTLNASRQGPRNEKGNPVLYFDPTIVDRHPAGKEITEYPQGRLPDKCVLCRYFEACPGLEETYFERYGASLVNIMRFPDESLVNTRMVEHE